MSVLFCVVTQRLLVVQDLDYVTLEDVTNRLSRNFGKLPTYAASQPVMDSAILQLLPGISCKS
jgi:hypothetical protein